MVVGNGLSSALPRKGIAICLGSRLWSKARVPPRSWHQVWHEGGFLCQFDFSSYWLLSLSSTFLGFVNIAKKICPLYTNKFTSVRLHTVAQHYKGHAEIRLVLLVSLKGRPFKNVSGFCQAISLGLMKPNLEIWFTFPFSMKAVTFRYSCKLPTAVPARAVTRQGTECNLFPPGGCDQQKLPSLMPYGQFLPYVTQTNLTFTGHPERTPCLICCDF